MRSLDETVPHWGGQWLFLCVPDVSRGSNPSFSESPMSPKNGTLYHRIASGRAEIWCWEPLVVCPGIMHLACLSQRLAGSYHPAFHRSLIVAASPCRPPDCHTQM